MCGIGGILLPTGTVGRDVLCAMRDAMVHRGPDDAGSWISPDGRVGLAHRRLSILDLSPAAAQPMGNEDGSVVVVFNGEIYNHASLRRELEAAGHRFVTDHSDTEVLVHGYEQWGIEGLLRRLQGMFAFGLWSAAERRLHLVRDRLGIKPLYFARPGGGIAFASEIKGLLTGLDLPRGLCGPALWHTLSFLTPPAPLTLFEGIFKLPAGHRLEVDSDGAMRASCWWRPVGRAAIDRAELSGLSDAARRDFFVTGIRTRLEAAVQSHLSADVPVGVFLSGGVDSSAITGLAARAAGGRVNSYTVGFSDHTHLNELDWAQSVSSHFGTDHHVVTISESDMLGYVDELMYTQDEPIADWVCVPLHFISRRVRETGTKVVLVGEGADEQFCGYDNYMRWLRIHRRYWQPWRSMAPRSLRQAVGMMAQGLARFRPGLAAQADLVSRAAEPAAEMFWSGAVALWEGPKNRLFSQSGHCRGSRAAEELVAVGLLPPGFLEPDSARVPAAILREMDEAAPGADTLARMTALELRMRLAELLLMRVDKVTMAQSLEARVPFLDHELVQFALDIPQADKIAGGAKGLLKQAVRGLVPDAVIERPKRGFGAPMSAWLKGDFGRHVQNCILSSALLDKFALDRTAINAMVENHRQGRVEAALPIWVLFNLVSWHRRWFS